MRRDRHEKHQGFLDILGNAICNLETHASNLMLKLMKADEDFLGKPDTPLYSKKP